MILADEPTGNLDADTTATVIATLRAVADDGATVAIATHDRSVVSAADVVLEV